MTKGLKDGQFNRMALVTSALILNDGPITGYRVMEVSSSPTGSVYPFLHSALEHGVLQETSPPETHVAKGGSPKFYDFTHKGLLLAHIELGLVQVPDLAQLVQEKAQSLET